MAQANPFLKDDLEKSRKKSVEKSVDDILVMAANDLKSPLGAVRTAVDLLGQFNHAPEITHLVELVQKNNDAAMAMVENLLEIQHLKPPRFQLHAETHSLDEILKQAVQDAALLAETHKIEIAARATGVSIICDRAAILRVLEHVLGCAIRFSPENSTIVVESEKLQSQVQISVIDNGPAPVGEDLRTSRPGFGLCLQISRMLVHAHNGTFGVNSTSGSTRFYFTLPL
jgi:signal transduction histidine kinase